MDTQTSKRRVPFLQWVERRLLVYRVLKDQTPPVRWVIVLKTPKGAPPRYFTYCQSKVWKWTAHKHRATTFRSYDRALQSARSCSLEWEHSYTIRELW